MAKSLRPKFEMHVVSGDFRRSRESQLISFIDEQYLGLDAMADNPAVLFTGPAGSGKTLLAMEATRRELAQGRTGRLLCFNRLLGLRLADEMGDKGQLIVGTLHQELLRIGGIKPPPNAPRSFWEHDLPDMALSVLLERGEDFVRDFIVVDEVQDVARPQFLDVLDLLVVGGLGGGRVLMFGDFARQAIFGNGDGRNLLKTLRPGLVLSRLVSNCRNLPRIGHVVNMFSNLDPGYQHFRRLDDGADPSFLSFSRGQDQSGLVADSIRRLQAEGFNLNEIAVLSPLRDGSTAEVTKDPWLRQILSAADGLPPRTGRVQFSTVQSFKGLEASAVVLTDLDGALVPNFESLLYIGLTRPTDRLIAIVESGTLRAALGRPA